MGRQIKKEKRIDEIRQIHKESHEIYGAPKIAEEMRKKGDAVSDKTVGNDMREIWIRACYTKHFTKTTIQPDFSREPRNILKEQLLLEHKKIHLRHTIHKLNFYMIKF